MTTHSTRTTMLRAAMALTVILSALPFLPAPAHAATFHRYVDADVSGGDGSGTSWENAYRYLQDALDEADHSTATFKPLSRKWRKTRAFGPS